jgi:nicotinamidase-related amidase
MAKTGLLLMDLQNGIVNHIVKDAHFISRIQKVTTIAREAAIPIIHVVVRFREQYPEVSPRNKAFGALKSGGFPLQEGNPAADIHSGVAPQPNDIIVTKRRVSAFSGSDLEIVLRSQEIDHLILTGIATSGVVLSTLRAGADMDYEITALSDCCVDRDEEVQRVLMEKIFPTQAEVMTAEQWSQRFRGHASPIIMDNAVHPSS